MDPFLLTSAGRLMRFLEHSHSHSSPYGKTLTIRSVWSGYLGMSDSRAPGARMELQLALAPVLQLPAVVRREVALLQDPDAAEQYLPSMSQVEAALAFSDSLDVGIENVHQAVDKGALSDLRHCHFALKRELRHAALAVEQIEELRAAVDLLREQVTSASDVDAGLRDELLKHVERMTELLDRVQIGGAPAFVEEGSRAAGSLLLQPSRLAQARKSAVWPAFTAVLATITLLAGAAEGADYLIERGREMLQLGTVAGPSEIIAPAREPGEAQL